MCTESVLQDARNPCIHLDFLCLAYCEAIHVWQIQTSLLACDKAFLHEFFDALSDPLALCAELLGDIVLRRCYAIGDVVSSLVHVKA